MKPKLAPQWKRILRQAWSVRLIMLAAVLSGIEVALPFLEAFVSIPAGIFAASSGLVTGAAFVARIMVQANMEDVQE